MRETVSSSVAPFIVQIGLECLCASLLVCVGVVSMMGRFKDIKLTTELNTRSVEEGEGEEGRRGGWLLTCTLSLSPSCRTYEVASKRDSFLTFNHRGQALSTILR